MPASSHLVFVHREFWIDEAARQKVADMKLSITVTFIALSFAAVLGPIQAQQRTGDEVMGDALRGAAGGVVIGAIAGDAGKGAAAGAVGGALFGGMERMTPDTPAGDAVSGAAKGALIGAVAGDAGKGAAAGAIGGVLLGGLRRNR